MGILKVKSGNEWLDIPAIVGPPGQDGNDYVLTAQDKADIAAEVTAPVQDVQVNGTSVLSNGVANVPAASANTYGVVKTGSGLTITNGKLEIDEAVSSIKPANSQKYPIVPAHQHEATFYGLAKAAGDTTQAQSSNAVGTYTAAAKTAIRNMLGVPDGSIYTETLSGPDVVINGEPNMKYVCGEISTLTVTPPSVGTIDIWFTSGTSATILSIQGVNWPGWFDPTSLETSATYEIMITDGVYGSVMVWES